MPAGRCRLASHPFAIGTGNPTERITTQASALVPAAELAKRNRMGFPGESDDYRRARIALLAEEIELRRHIERVARSSIERLVAFKRERGGTTSPAVCRGLTRRACELPRARWG
jgi:hypothetical protein